MQLGSVSRTGTFGIVETEPPFHPSTLRSPQARPTKFVAFFEAALRSWRTAQTAHPDCGKQYHAGYYAALCWIQTGHNIEAVFRGS
jgi:hypothetical protein